MRAAPSARGSLAASTPSGRRVAEISGLDLGDPEARFAAMLQLRVIAPR